MSSPTSSSPLRLLTIVAHPHDVTYTLGTSAHHIDRGDSVTVVTLTDGATTHDEELEDELRKPADQRRGEILERPRCQQADKKEHEIETVCAIFGIKDVRVLPFADHPIEDTPALRRQLCEIFYDVRPHIVITHAPFDDSLHGFMNRWDDDHCKTGMIVHQTMHAVKKADPQRRHSPHHVAQLYYIGVTFGPERIDLYVDVTDQIDKRIEAEALYESQGHTGELARKRIEAFAGFAGWWGGTGYAEPFLRANRQVSRYLLVTDEDLHVAQLSGREQLERISRFACVQSKGAD